MNLRLVVTEDGSHTIVDEHLQESYHSTKGALGESAYVFIEQGLLKAAPGRRELAILEVGLGTGLNVLLTAQQVAREGFPSLVMTCLEPAPLAPTLVARLNYVSLLPDFPQAAIVFRHVHAGAWGIMCPILPALSLTKQRLTLQDFVPDRAYDLIYFDAFAPNKQADVWGQSNIAKAYACLRPGGILVTYCAQGAFRRSLRNAGFQTERVPGYGKREMTRATKP